MPTGSTTRVVGTPNRLEYDQGFFVKNGDGAADVKPIAHLYKTQVYAMARTSGCPRKSATPSRPPILTACRRDRTSSISRCLTRRWIWRCGRSITEGLAGELAQALEVTEEQASLIFADIAAKRRASRYLHQAPLLVKPVDELFGE